MAIKRDGKGTPIFNLPFNISMGEISGVSIHHKFGRCSVVEDTIRTVWTSEKDDAVYSWPGSELEMTVSSTNSADSVDVPGAIDHVVITGLSEDFTTFTESVAIVGLTPVTLVNKIFRVNEIICFGENKTSVNTGDIWLGAGKVTNGVPDKRYGHVSPGNNMDLHGFYTIPKNICGRLDFIDGCVNKAKEGEISVWFRDNSIDKSLMLIGGIFDIYQTAHNVALNLPLSLNEKTDIEFRAMGGVVDTKVSVLFSMILIESSYICDTRI